jgi:dihydrofolate reductase
LRKIIYAMTVSLDGAIESPAGVSPDWVVPDEELHRHFNEGEAAEFSTHLYGRRMWEGMAAFWPTAEADESIVPWAREYAPLWTRVEKIVVSNTLSSVDHGARLIRGHQLLDEVQRLKALDGKSISVGGAALAVSLAEQGLVDEFRFYTAPIVLGGGKQMFEGLSHPLPLRLIDTRRFASGVVLSRYAPATG